MESILNDFAESISEKLIKIINESNEFYLKLGSGVTERLHHINEIEKRMIAGKNDLRADDEKTGTQSICHNCDAVKNEIISDKEILLNLLQEYDSIHLSLSEMAESLEILHSQISEIPETTEEMDLIALNALTAAVKSGNEGQAFSYITQQIKKYANTIQGISADLGKDLVKIREEYVKLQNEFEEANDLQKSIISTMDESLLDLLESYKPDIKTLDNYLRKIYSSLVNIKKKSSDILQAIQYQDILRQSINHISISISELKNSMNSSDIKEIDKITFQYKITDLTTYIMDEISTKIDKNLNLIKNSMDEIGKEISESQSVLIQEDQNYSIHTLRSRIEDLSRDVELFSENLSYDLNNTERMRKDLILKKKDFLKLLRPFDASFQLFMSRARQFKTINVAAKIETTKTRSLGSIQATVKHMTEIVQSLTRSIGLCGNELDSFKKNLNENYNSLKNHSIKEEDSIKEFISKLEKNFSRLRLSLKNSMRHNWDIYSDYDKFRTSIFRNNTWKEEMDSIRQLVDETCEASKNWHEETTRHLNNSTTEQDIIEWNIENSRFRQLVDQFTILSHKAKAAASISDMAIQGGDPDQEEGEVLLF